MDWIKDMIICGGESIYPQEVETVLESHASVVEAAAAGGSHDVLSKIDKVSLRVRRARLASPSQGA
ncbi:MAG TPA: hypothetical protein VLJ88_04455 [Propionibacteriaceae bacterium]|nr:hypothetical protein [Propionibacteriaceae bacterium]